MTVWILEGDPGQLPPEQSTDPTVSPKAILPVWAGTWRNGQWRSDTSDLYQGDYSGRGVNQGAAFFGAYLAAVGSYSALTVRMTRLAAPGSPMAAVQPTMRLLAGTTYQDTYPAVLATAAGPLVAPDAVVDWGVPSSWVGQLQSGAAGGIGVGVTGASPYVLIDGELEILVNVYTAAGYGLGFGFGPFGQTPFGGNS